MGMTKDDREITMPQNCGVVLKNSRTISKVLAPLPFTDKNGPVIQNVQVNAIFYGTYWSDPHSLSASSLFNDMAYIVSPSSGYMSELSQYRNISYGTKRHHIKYDDQDPPFQFNDKNITNLIEDQLSFGGDIWDPDNPQVVFFVILPVGVTYAPYPNWIGAHYCYKKRHHTRHYAWITNDGTRDYITNIFSHELVEIVTDPEGTGITGVPGTSAPVLVGVKLVIYVRR
jgi:hypothetical protein